jgi:hypothetical protein
MMDISKLQLHRVTERDVKNDVHLLKLVTDSMLSIQFELQAASLSCNFSSAIYD